MKKIPFYLLTFGLLLTSCNNDEENLYTDKADDTENIDISSQTNIKQGEIASMPRPFEWKLLGEICKDADNVIMSPIGLEYVLAMAANGANGNTRDEIIRQLYSENTDIEDINDYYCKMSETLNNIDNTVSFVSVNSLWADNNLNVSEGFTSQMKSIYDAETYLSPKEDMVNQVNKWIAESTNARISGIIDNPAPFIILNASYLKAGWSCNFDKTSTGQSIFHGNTKSVTADFMSTFEKLEYCGNDFFDVVRKDLGNGQFSFNLLLPRGGVSIRQCIDYLTNHGVPNTWASRYVSLKMPKFKVDYRVSLRNTLIKLGIKTAFESYADFSEISPYSLMLSDVKQSNTIEVNESGLDVASVSSAEFVFSATDHKFDNVITLTADHPFPFNLYR